MNITKKIIFTVFASFLFVSVARAATNQVAFDPGTGTLSVSGSCSAKFVLVVIRRASDGSIWGSSNPPCAKGSYEYDVTVPEGDRSGGTFLVDAVDSDSAAQVGTAKSSAGGGASSPAAVTFSAPVSSSADATITIDTSSVVAVPDDQSFLDATLSQFFGIVADVNNAVQAFIKASVVATVSLFSKTVTILPNGSITVPRGANQMAGGDWLAAGGTSVFIPNTLVTSSSEIIVTPTTLTDVPLVVTEKDSGFGFRVGMAHPAVTAISFDWLVIQTYNATSSAVAEQSVSFAQPFSGNASQPAVVLGGSLPATDLTPAPAPPPASIPLSDNVASTTIVSSSTDSMPVDATTSVAANDLASSTPDEVFVIDASASSSNVSQSATSTPQPATDTQTTDNTTPVVAPAPAPASTTTATTSGTSTTP